MKIEIGKNYRTASGEKGECTRWDDENDVFLIKIPGLGRSFGFFADGKFAGQNNIFGTLDIVSEWHEGPVQTVTRKEIVPGDYKGVIIEEANGRVVRLKISHVMFTASDLREAANLFNTVAEALEENAKGEANDGWIEWNGGECPVGAEDEVHYRLRCGVEFKAAAGQLRWGSSNPVSSLYSNDITHYRVVKP